MTFDGRTLHYRLLDPAVSLVALHNREIEVGFDQFDLETVALYCEGRFLGLAANAELRKMGSDAFVADEKNRRAARREIRRFITAVHAAVPVADPVQRAARRLAIRPKPVVSEPSGTEITVPAEIREAVAAAAKDRQFSFAAASGADLVRLADARAYEDDKIEDSEFVFFGGQG